MTYIEFRIQLVVGREIKNMKAIDELIMQAVLDGDWGTYWW